MKDYEDLTKEELIKLIDKNQIEKLRKKATLKEIVTCNFIKEDTLFITPNGFIIGKPFVDDNEYVSPYLILTNVIFLSSLTPPVKRLNFNNMTFQLAIDQIIAFAEVDRDSFLNQLESPQYS